MIPTRNSKSQFQVALQINSNQRAQYQFWIELFKNKNCIYEYMFPYHADISSLCRKVVLHGCTVLFWKLWRVEVQFWIVNWYSYLQVTCAACASNISCAIMLQNITSIISRASCTRPKYSFWIWINVQISRLQFIWSTNLSLIHNFKFVS